MHASSAWDGPRGAALDDVSLAVHAVRAGGAMASSYFGRTIAVTSKSQRSDVVSEADLTVERFLVGLLHERRPADGVLAEEGSSRPGARTWVLDPLDGTQNFVRGDGYWCTAIALTDERGTAVSAIHHPTTGDTYWAVRGAGAWCNGQRLVVPPDCPLESAQLAAFLDTGGNDLQVLAAVVARVATTRMRGSGSLELAWLARGLLDVWLQRAVPPWDWLPGALIVTEAGGCAEVFPAFGSTWYAACGPKARDELLDIFRGSK